MPRHIFTCVIFLGLPTCIRAEALSLEGKIDSVTLYRGQALVTRKIELNLKAGASELTVTKLPEYVQGPSLYASAGEGLQVRAVQYQTRAVGEAPREEIRKSDEKTAELDKSMRKNKSDQMTIMNQQQYMAGLQKFVAPTANVELTKGVLNAETLQALTDFSFKKHQELNSALLDLQEKERELQKQQTLEQSRRSRLTHSSSRTEREAIVFLDAEKAGKFEMRLSYLVTSASWSPAYNMRANGDLTEIELEYNALIQQMSGEPWDDVQLVLSTASPSMLASPPVLAPLPVRLTQRRQQRKQVDLKQQLSQIQRDIRSYSSREATSGKSMYSNEGQIDANLSMNRLSNQRQLTELSASRDDVRAIQMFGRKQSAGLSVNYRLKSRVSVASRSNQQIVRISDLSLPCVFSNVALPQLTDLVYRKALVTDGSGISLLEGPCSVYLDGDFVGRGVIPMVATGQKFRAGFGIDPQLRAWREFVSREEKIQGGNRMVTYKYRLVLDNYKKENVPVRVFDRMPYSTGDIKATIGELEDKLSEDKEYERAFRPLGILRWDVDVKAGSAAETARIVDYGFQLEFDKDMDIATITGSEMERTGREYLMKRLNAE